MALFRALNQTGRLKPQFDYLPPGTAYFDSACQTLRPQAVIDAVDAYYREYNACGGRVKYEWGIKVDERVEAARRKLLKMAGKSERDYVCAFTLNTTYGINLILSQLPKNRFEQMVTSTTEHNSVFLPTITWAKALGMKRRVLERNEGALVYKPGDLAKSVVVVNSTSNFDGSHLTNAKQLVSDTHRAGGIVIFDAAQTMAHQPELVKSVDFDAICFSGHKLYGPSLGIIVISKKLLNMLSNDFIGGGMVSDVWRDSFELIADQPARLEAGLQNFSGIIGLEAAIDWLERVGPAARKQTDTLARKLYEEINALPALTMVTPGPSPIISFYSDRVDAHKLAIHLSADNIMVRSGYFCCHYYLSELKKFPPILRVSLGLNNDEVQVDRLIASLRKLLV